ncbi:MAG TPA: TonB-dependent receptor [Longimicrobium sp.]|nr:TonB-dependent receptor [Longimicrobium sp.]
MTLRILCPLALLWCALAPAAAAQTLEGRAVDRESLEPIPGAILTLVDSAGEHVAAVRADASGQFALRAPEPGAFAVSAARMGFAATLTRAVPLQAGEKVAVEVRMAPRAASVDPAAGAVPLQRGITGRLVDDRTGQPVPNARIALLTAREQGVSTAATDSAGVFHLGITTPGGYVLRAEPAGYRRTQSAVLTITPRDTVQVELRVATDAVVLAPLTVVAGAERMLRDHQLAGFEFRARAQPFGHFMNREQIQALNPFNATDALQQVPTVSVVGGGYDQTLWLPARAQPGVTRCRANVYVDGLLIRGLGSSLTVNELARGSSLAGLEVYTSAVTAPGEFPPVENRSCGVILIWTDLVTRS